MTDTKNYIESLMNAKMTANYTYPFSEMDSRYEELFRKFVRNKLSQEQKINEIFKMVWFLVKMKITDLK